MPAVPARLAPDAHEHVHAVLIIGLEDLDAHAHIPQLFRAGLDGVEKQAVILEQPQQPRPGRRRDGRNHAFHKPLGLLDIERFFADAGDGLELEALVAQAQQRAGMAFGQARLEQIAAHGGREMEQPQLVGDERLALAEARGERFLRHAVCAQQLAVAFRLLDKVQVAPLQVFDQRKDGAGLLRGALHDAGHLPHADQATGAQPALAGDELVHAGNTAHDQGLDQPGLRDGGRQLLQALLVELAARLVRVRLNAVYGQHHQLPALYRRRLPGCVGLAREHRHMPMPPFQYGVSFCTDKSISCRADKGRGVSPKQVPLLAHGRSQNAEGASEHPVFGRPGRSCKRQRLTPWGLRR